MKITIFNNKKGLIHGPNPKRIGCETAGVLKIGATELSLPAGADVIMPMLFNGCTGDYPGTFTTLEGEVYTLEKVAVRGGWVQPPHPTTVELMELRCRADEAEDRIASLEGLFDTNALNFLI
jgi:hypothetical protein